MALTVSIPALRKLREERGTRLSRRRKRDQKPGPPAFLNLYSLQHSESRSVVPTLRKARRVGQPFLLWLKGWANPPGKPKQSRSPQGGLWFWTVLCFPTSGKERQKWGTRTRPLSLMNSRQ